MSGVAKHGDRVERCEYEQCGLCDLREQTARFESARRVVLEAAEEWRAGL